MSWLFSRALAEEYSVAGFLDGAQSAQLSVMPTQHPFWHAGKTMDASNHSLFGQTLQVLTVGRGEELLMSYLEASRARTSARQGRAQESTASEAACGPRWPGLLAKYDPDSSSWRTAQFSLLGGLDEYSETWPRWGSMRAGVCWELPRPAFPTDESESGLSLPTPSGVNGGRNHTMGRVDEWGGSSNPLRGTVIGSLCLPEFEEMVMGWPVSWTAPTPFETDRFRQWLRLHGAPSAADKEVA